MSVRIVVCGLALLLAYWIIAFFIPAAAPSTNKQLSWRQKAIINHRAKVHHCQDELGVHRSPVAQRVITGGPAYRAWVLHRWRTRLDFCRDALTDLNMNPRKAIMAVFGMRHGPSAIRVFSCESGLSTGASNGQYLGIAQMGSWARSNYGHGYTVLAQVRAAHRLWLAVGMRWTGQWPVCGYRA